MAGEPVKEIGKTDSGPNDSQSKWDMVQAQRDKFDQAKLANIRQTAENLKPILDQGTTTKVLDVKDGFASTGASTKPAPITTVALVFNMDAAVSAGSKNPAAPVAIDQKVVAQGNANNTSLYEKKGQTTDTNDKVRTDALTDSYAANNNKPTTGSKKTTNQGENASIEATTTSAQGTDVAYTGNVEARGGLGQSQASGEHDSDSQGGKNPNSGGGQQQFS